MASVAQFGIGLLTVIGLGVASTACGSPGPEQVTVVGHVDGDTFDIERDDARERIRLVNIDAPDLPAQCLGPEAANFLAALIPIGTSIRVEFDKEPQDEHGRTVAAAFVGDGRMVNAEVVRAGFAVVRVFDNNIRFLPSIQQAAREAQAAQRGLLSPATPCTDAAKAQAAETARVQAQQQAARVEAERVAAALADQRRLAVEAERLAAQAARAAEAEARRNKARSDDESSSGSSNPSGYTGPRCYAPGGKTWHPC